MMASLPRGSGETYRQRDIGKKACEDGSRDWSHVATAKERQEHQKWEEVRRVLPSGPQREPALLIP